MFVNKPSLYIHIPYCISKCTYCDFFSITNSMVPDEYVFALLKEFDKKIEKYNISKFYSVYFGGGTPSLLNKKQIELLLKKILPYTEINTEITFECNCDDISIEFLEFLKSVGINRVSVGVQTFNKKSLSCIKRRASQEETFNAIKHLSKFYEKNKDFKISVDFISGLPFSTDKTLIEDLSEAIKLNIPHISLYSLTLEERTPLYKSILSGKIPFDETLANDQWILGRNFLIKNGYCEYEVSNFAFKGFESLHNSFYWECKDYIGIGSGAVQTTYDKNGKSGNRITNSNNLLDYIKNSPDNIKEIEYLDLNTVYFEYLMTGFRTSNGVNSKEFFNRFGIKLENILEDKFDKYVKQNHARIDGDNYYFLPDGMLFLNQFLVEII